MSRERRFPANTGHPELAAPDAAAADPRLRAAMQRRTLQRKATREASQPTTVPQGGGAPLDAGVRRRMEGQLGADLSQVTVHTGSESARAASDLGARAFTDGQSVHFNRGEYAPGSKEGDRLLAHELAHTVQGAHAGVARKADAPERGGDQVSQPGDPAEKEADDAADQVADRLHGAGEKEAAPPSLKEQGSAVSRKPDAQAGAHADGPKPGANGIVSADTTVKVGGKDQALQKGTVVKVKSVEGSQLMVTVQSGHGGEQAEIPASAFQAEPGVDTDEDTQKPRDDVYQEYQGALWGKDGPTEADVAQGYIGDCFLMASMGAVVAQNPGAIKKLFSPQTPGAKSYQVTLYKKTKDKQFEPVTLSVDTQLPTQKGTDHNPAYADNGEDMKTAALWPALLEKAYAQLVGGYEKAGEGGVPGDGMEALTGVKSGNEDIPDEKSTISQFTKFQKEGKAVVAGSIGELQAEKKHVFEGDHGAFSAKLQTNEGLDAEIAEDTLEVDDSQSKHHSHAKDDGKGKLKSTDLESGTVDYSSGAVELKYKADKGPDKAKNLEASYQYRGMISKDLKLYADHSYIFERVDGDKLIFKNPWGSSHPNPIPAAEFVKFFDSLDTNGGGAPDAGK